MKLYGDLKSGNCYKVSLLLKQLGTKHEFVKIDIMKGETRTPEFITKSANGQIPLLEISPGQYLPESDAIMWYLADGTPFLPEDKFQRAQVLQWLFFEQYSHEPHIATARFIKVYLGNPPERQADLLQKAKRGYEALDVMEKHLASNKFFVGGRYSIADIGLYAYTHVAHEGGFDLAPYPYINAWLARVKAQQNYLEMTG
ncbi:MAG: glutathione S-transferase family protein [Burkholderiales bacterium]